MTDSSVKTFTIDLSGDVSVQISQIDAYLSSVTGEALGLRVQSNGTITTLLPATLDYQTYTTYLHTLGSSESIDHGVQSLVAQHEQQGSVSHEKSSLSLFGTLLCLLLALFL